MKKTIKLNAEQRLMLKKAERGLISSDLHEALQAVVKGKASNPVHKLRTLYLGDESYDGKEDRGRAYRFVPENRLNVFGAVCLEKYGQPFGPILLAYLLAARPHRESRRQVNKWRDELVASMFPNVDLGERKTRQNRGPKRSTFARVPARKKSRKS